MAYTEGNWSESKQFITLSDSGTNPVEDKVVLELIRNIEMSVGGKVFVDKEGNFHYDSRTVRHL
jgi:hypothetical protein